MSKRRRFVGCLILVDGTGQTSDVERDFALGVAQAEPTVSKRIPNLNIADGVAELEAS